MEKTTDYEIFKKHESNTPIDPANLRKVVASIKCRNLLEMRPIVVDAEMRVIDGQHRLEAAKILNLPIFYEIKKKAVAHDMVLLNEAQRKWKLENYVHFWAAEGNENYQKLLRFCQDCEISVQDFFKFSKRTGARSNKKVRLGTFCFLENEIDDKIKEKGEFVREVISFLSPKLLCSNKNFLYSSAFRRGLIFLMQNPEFENAVFMQKLEIQIPKVVNCTKSGQYYEMFKSIYNYRNMNPLI